MEHGSEYAVEHVARDEPAVAGGLTSHGLLQGGPVEGEQPDAVHLSEACVAIGRHRAEGACVRHVRRGAVPLLHCLRADPNRIEVGSDERRRIGPLLGIDGQVEVEGDMGPGLHCVWELVHEVAGRHCHHHAHGADGEFLCRNQGDRIDEPTLDALEDGEVFDQ